MVAKAVAVGRRGAAVPAQSKGRGARQDQRVIDGHEVVTDEPVLSNLPSHAPTRVRKLTLADGSVRYGCVRCPYTDVTRDLVRGHFKREHSGDDPPGEPVAEPVPTAVVPVRKAPRAGRVTLDPDAATMTLGELVQIAVSATRFGAVIEAEQAQTAKWRKRAEEAEIKLRRLTHALDRAGFSLKLDEES